MKNKSVRKVAALVACFAILSTSFSLLSAKPGEQRGEGFGPGKSKMGQHQRGHRGGQRMDPGLRLIQMGEKLGLTTEQEEQILALSQDFRAEMKTNREGAKATREKMKALRESETFDETALRAVLEEGHAHKVESMVAGAKYREAISEVLTEEQNAQIEEAKEKIQKMRKMREKRGGQGKRGQWQGKGQNSSPETAG